MESDSGEASTSPSPGRDESPAVSGSAPAPAPGPASGGSGGVRSRLRRIRGWISSHGPQTLVGATVVAVLAAVAAAVVSGLFESGGGGDDPARPPSAAGEGAGPSGGAAEECRGERCRMLKPAQAGCDDDAQVLRQRDQPVVLQLKYSPYCEAAWAKITSAEVGDQVVITSEGGKPARDVVATGNDNHTTMVPAEGRFRLRACAEPDDSDGSPRWQKFCVEATAADVKRTALSP